LIPAIRAAAARLDGNLPLSSVRTFDEVRAAYLAERRFAMVLMLIFGGLAFALAFLGLYGVINYLVQLRTREIGVRIAIGATTARVRREVLERGAPRIAGVAISAGPRSRGQISRSPGSVVSCSDPRLAIALGRHRRPVVPAWRATRVDPVQALPLPLSCGGMPDSRGAQDMPLHRP
jgi:hypothetical protein